jgi:nitrogen fixation NifU-like protein
LISISRIPLPYSQKVIELFRNPKNQGKMKNPTVIALAGNPACGDMITFYMKINDQEIIEKITFESYGCAANIATASIVTEMVNGLSLKDTWKELTWKKVVEEVGGLPNVKSHCGILAVGAVKRGIRKYYQQKDIIPNWIPQELTSEEKQALEEEELAEKLSKK